MKIALAELLAKIGSNLPAVGWLTQTLDDTSQDPRIRLQAINALTFIPDAAHAALDAVDRAAVGDDEYLRGAGSYLRLVLRGTYTPQSPLYQEVGKPAAS